MTQYSGNREVSMPQHILAKLLADAAELGATAAFTKAGILKPFLSKTEAYNIYGRRTIDRWLEEKRIKAIRMSHNSTKRYISRVELEAVHKSIAPVLSMITIS